MCLQTQERTKDFKVAYLHGIWKYLVDDITKGDCVEWGRAQNSSHIAFHYVRPLGHHLFVIIAS